MITSMTGFAALTREDERATVSVTVRAVNHRFLDVQLRLPQSLADREGRIRALVQQAVARGRIELGVSVQLRQAAVPHVELNAAARGSGRAPHAGRPAAPAARHHDP